LGRCVGGGSPNSVMVGGGVCRGGLWVVAVHVRWWWVVVVVVVDVPTVCGGCGGSFELTACEPCVLVRANGMLATAWNLRATKSRSRSTHPQLTCVQRQKRCTKGRTPCVCDDDGERVTRSRVHNSENTQLSQHSRHERARTCRRITIESSFTRAIRTATCRQRVDTLTGLTALKGHSPGGPGPKIVEMPKIVAALMQKE
jgi:hypothetical protein